jgi:phosphoribosylformylglycinamidine synthase I
MRVGVVVFPGSNCDQDCLWALGAVAIEAVPLWHKDDSLQGCDAVILPGGFSYGDYLRCGAIARLSPIMSAISRHSKAGGVVIGICNGFQILTEAGLLPGTLLRNAGLRFICRPVSVRVEQTASALTRGCNAGQVLSLPIAHAEGRYWLAESELQELEARGQVVLRYCTADGRIDAIANPNGSLNGIAGVCNIDGNVVGLMPHPERVVDAWLGGTDGRCLLTGLTLSASSTAPVTPGLRPVASP